MGTSGLESLLETSVVLSELADSLRRWTVTRAIQDLLQDFSREPGGNGIRVGVLSRTPTLTWQVLVGVAGFEPAASSSRTKRAAKLRHTPVTARAV